MSSNRRASKAQKSTIYYHRLPFDEHQFFNPDAFLSKDRGTNHQSQSTQPGSRHTDRRLTTPQLASALAGIWNLVRQPESSATEQRSESYGNLHNEDPVCFSRDQKGHTLTSCPAESSTGLSSQTSLSTPKSIHDELSSVKKMLMLTSCSNMFGVSSTWRHGHLTNKLGAMQFLQCQNICPMQTEKIGTYAAPSDVNIKEDECLRRDDNYQYQTRHMPTDQCTSSSEEANIMHVCQSSIHDAKSNVDLSREYHSSACSSQQMAIGKEGRIIQEQHIPSTREHIELQASTCTLVGEAVVPPSANQYTHGEYMYQPHSEDKHSPEVESSFEHRFHGAITANKHAVAGAVSGTVVSISLHPVDTVKTIIQANSSGQSSFHHILRRTLVERGVLGLYGGLASKIACSAPISAIYTLTYEIVKGALLPTLPKDYHSIAHCAAGGCSSIATSFVFTPSECIKQQMQVGSQYQNCWKALVGCLQRGGIASLYAGWGAVLCRNIPHSIVKFYAYESLKQFLLNRSPANNAKLDSGQTLFCGGFAGSTAALFTTPFDVVKTRVQLQALSPVRKYAGVSHALTQIFQQEGLRGLYRGLTPRLVMYVSQGALFFTSYEFLKTIMFPEQELPAMNV